MEECKSVGGVRTGWKSRWLKVIEMCHQLNQDSLDRDFQRCNTPHPNNIHFTLIFSITNSKGLTL
jgi:hypothetical protein